ncbi:MAG: hypothetical protein K2J39_01370, partial [Ruminococcus sp.]|nr:hypothetical protein [Ruminococcus sp.]
VNIWGDSVQRTQISLSMNLPEKDFSNQEAESEYIWDNHMNLFSSDENLYEIFLYKALNGENISYCSCINDYKALKKSPFDYVVTTRNNLNRLRNEQAVNEEPPVIEEPEFIFPQTHTVSNTVSNNNRTFNSYENSSYEYERSKKITVWTKIISMIKNLIRKIFRKN